MSHTTHTFLATRELYSSNESIHSRQINEIKISSFRACTYWSRFLFIVLYLLHGCLAFKGSVWIRRYNRRNGICARAPSCGHRPSVDKRLISQLFVPRECVRVCVCKYVCLWMRDYPIFLFLFIIFLPYRYRLSMLRWPIIIVQSCSYISDKRGSVVASCRAWIKSRICFRGEGESDGGSLGIYGRLYSSLLSSAPRSTAYNLRYRKIDVVDSPTIHAAFVTACRCLYRRNMKILFAFSGNLRTKGSQGNGTLKSHVREKPCERQLSYIYLQTWLCSRINIPTALIK